MKKKILALLITCTISLSCIGCGLTYQEVTDNVSTENDYGNGYFTVISEWGMGEYRIVYANDTKVKYLVVSRGYHYGITPLYNADGSLQIYNEEE